MIKEKDIDALIEKLETHHNIDKEELVTLLALEDPSKIYQAADRVRKNM